MKALTLCFLIALSIIATVALLPVSRWVFLNQLDLLSPQSTESSAFDQDMTLLMPHWLTNPETYRGKNASEEFAHAVFLHYPLRNEALLRYANEHPTDPLGWAELARLVCMMGGRAPDEPGRDDPKRRETADQVFGLGHEACLRGAALEPTNAYFPLMRAMFDMELNNLDDMAQALATAAKATNYNGHFADEARTLERAEQSAKGYRGELVKTGLDASLLFPHLAHIKALAKYLNRNGSLQEKRDLVQTENTIIGGGDVAIDFLVAIADVKILLHPPIPVGTTAPFNKISDSEWLGLAAAFDAKLKAANVSPPAPTTSAIYEKLNRLLAATKKYIEIDFRSSIFEEAGSDENAVRLAYFQMVSPYAALCSLVFSVVFAVLAWAFSQIRSDTFRKMVPHFVFLPAWFATLLFMESNDAANSAPFVGLIFGIGQLALMFLCVGKPAPKPWLFDLTHRSRIASIAGAILALAAILSANPGAAVGGIAYLVTVGLSWKTASGQTPKISNWGTLTMFVLLCLGAGAAFTWRGLLQAHPGEGIACVGLISLIAASWFTGKPNQSARIATCASFVLISAVYLATVGVEVRANHRQMLADTNLLNEANKIRAMADIRS